MSYMTIGQGTTPTITLDTVDDLRDMEKVRLTITDGKETFSLDKEELIITENAVQGTLTQSQTLKLKGPRVQVQIRVKNSDGEVFKTQIANLILTKSLDKTVL